MSFSEEEKDKIKGDIHRLITSRHSKATNFIEVCVRLPMRIYLCVCVCNARVHFSFFWVECVYCVCCCKRGAVDIVWGGCSFATTRSSTVAMPACTSPLCAM